jgi:hypothetical protein
MGLHPGGKKSTKLIGVLLQGNSNRGDYNAVRNLRMRSSPRSSSLVDVAYETRM